MDGDRSAGYKFPRWVDLLALNPEGHLIVIELKRDQTPREVVSQGLDYASWAQGLTSDQIADIYQRFSGGGSLSAAFYERFGHTLDEDQLNGSHQVVIVASSLDPATERIVNYLNGLEVPINVIFFQVFRDGDARYLSRSWLIDPVETENKASSVYAASRGPWNQEYYVSFGDDQKRRLWEEAREYGFISGGGGKWHSQTLFLLSEGDRIWVNVPNSGYVGVGRVTGQPIKASEFRVEVDGKEVPFLEVAKADYGRADSDNENLAEYFVPVRWIDTRPLTEAISEVGLFGNQNTVCRPRTSKWTHTVDRLQHFFDLTADE
jgi:hypothetical protein